VPAKPSRAPVALAMIVKDGEATLPTCLKSVRPYVQQIVVAVDERTTDKTAKVARRHGADVVVPVQVSDWHECPEHGRVLAQHFGRARNESFGHLDPAIPWKLWLDADDWLQGGEHLADVVAGIPPGAVGCWLPYRYATLNNYQATTTLFDRERLLRSSVGWRWDYRVHEVVVPLVDSPKWALDQRVQVVHQEGVHKSEASTTRNQLLLEIDWEEEPDNQRTAFYLANGFFAANQFARAAEWYERTTEIGTNPWEVWQSFCYLSMALRRLGDVDGAARAAFAAVDGQPDYREGYYRLAECYLAAGEWTKAIHWAEVGLGKGDPPRFVFKNPLDTSVNVRTILGEAFGRIGHVTEARRQLEQAHAVAPTPELAGAIAEYARIEAASQSASAFCHLAATLPDEERLRLYRALPDDVKQISRVRDLVMPGVMERRAQRHVAEAKALLEKVAAMQDETGMLIARAEKHRSAAESIVREVTV